MEARQDKKSVFLSLWDRLSLEIRMPASVAPVKNNRFYSQREAFFIFSSYLSIL